MKKVLLLTLLLLTTGCATDSPKVYAKAIAEELHATSWEYTFKVTEPNKKYLIDFYTYEPNHSYSIWLCRGSGKNINCELIQINHL